MKKYENIIDHGESHREWSRFVEKHVEMSCNGTGPHAEFVMLRPALADVMFSRMGKNRGLKASRLGKLQRDFDRGNKTLTPDGLGFTVAGRFVNGQHRCTTVIGSGSGVPVFVVFGLSDDDKDIANIDQGTPKSSADVLSVWGPVAGNANLVVAALRSAEGGASGGGRQFTTGELYEIAERHTEAVDAILPMFGRSLPGVKIAPVIGCHIRAYYHEKLENISRFADVLMGGDVESPIDNNAVRLRTHLIEKKKETGSSAWADKYKRTQYAMAATCDGRKIGRVMTTPRELYPFPWEA